MEGLASIESPPERGQTDAFLKQARAAEAARDFELARDLAGKCVDMFPNDGGFHALKAWYTFNTSSIEWTERLRLTDHHMGCALELAPGDAMVHLCRGRILQMQNNKGGAKTAVETALSLRPDWKEALVLLDQINDGLTPPPQVMASWKLEKKKPARFGRTMALAGVALLLGVVSLVGYLDRGNYFEMKALAAELGTKLSFTEAPQAGSSLWLAVDKEEWAKLSDADRVAELRAMGPKLEARGVDEVKVFIGGVLSASVKKGGTPCVTATCLYGPGGPPKL